MDVAFAWWRTSVATAVVVDALVHRRVAAARARIVAVPGKHSELTQCCVIGIEYTFLDLALAVRLIVARSLAEAAPSRQLRRSPVAVHAIRRSHDREHATQFAAVAKHPTEIATEVPASRRISQRESHALGKFHMIRLKLSKL